MSDKKSEISILEDHSLDLKEGLKTEHRLGVFKKGISDLNRETELLEKIIKLFAYKYFILYKGGASRESVWKSIVANDRIEGVDLKRIPEVKPNNYSGLVRMARAITEPPVYKIKSLYDDINPRGRLAIAMNCGQEIGGKVGFPEIILIGTDSDETPHSIKQKLGEKAVERLKAFVLRTTDKSSPSRIGLAGGTSILRFVSELVHTLSSDQFFMKELQKKMAPIEMVEIANPGSLLSLGLMENTRTTYLMFKDMDLAGEYITFNKFQKNKNKYPLKAIYSGVGNPETESVTASNQALLKILKEKKGYNNFQFEVNGVPYFADSEIQKKARKKMMEEGLSISAIEEIAAEHRIIICGGLHKEQAVYSLINYCVENPNKTPATHLIMPYSTFSGVMNIASANNGNEKNTEHK